MIRGDAGPDGDLLAGGALLGLFDLAVLEGLEGDLALDQLLVEDLVQRAQAVLGRGASTSSFSPSSMAESVFLKSNRVAASRLA